MLLAAPIFSVALHAAYEGRDGQGFDLAAALGDDPALVVVLRLVLPWLAGLALLKRSSFFLPIAAMYLLTLAGASPFLHDLIAQTVRLTMVGLTVLLSWALFDADLLAPFLTREWRRWRGAGRVPIIKKVSVTTEPGGHRVPAFVCNASDSGVGLVANAAGSGAALAGLRPDDTIWLEFAGGPLFAAAIVWISSRNNLCSVGVKYMGDARPKIPHGSSTRATPKKPWRSPASIVLRRAAAVALFLAFSALMIAG